MRNPYVTGAYVTGGKHYGRQDQIDHLLHGESCAYWVIGNRRIGKTSLLRQLEALALTEGRYVPLVWDMQGCDTFRQLGQYLADAVRDCSDRFEPLGLAPAIRLPEDVLTLLGTLKRAGRQAGRDVLLLCDEPEVLIEIAWKAPAGMQRLHHVLTSGDGLRVVAASTRTMYRMDDVCRSWPTSTFLAGFDMSQTLGGLDERNAHALISQAQAEEPVRAAAEVVEAIRNCTNSHPYLMQYLCSRLFQANGRLRAPQDSDLSVDPLLRGFFKNDFGTLSEADRKIVLGVHRAGLIDERSLMSVVSETPGEIRSRLRNLEALGHIRRSHDRYALGNQFLSNWLSAGPSALDGVLPPQTSETAMHSALARQQAEELNFLVSKLNARRGQLVELEAVRARDLLAVSPQVLAEIDQLQEEIRQLRNNVDEIRSL